MKRISQLSIIFLMIGFFLCASSSFAQVKHKKHPPKQGKHKPNPEKIKAAKVMNKTSKVIHFTHKAVKENKVYTGKLSKAVSHQKYALRLFNTGKFKRAIAHSLRARKLSREALEANKGTPTDDFDVTDDEKGLAEEVTDEELDKEVENIKIDEEELMEEGVNGLDIKL